jgi:hypothetical protein
VVVSPPTTQNTPSVKPAVYPASRGFIEKLSQLPKLATGCPETASSTVATRNTGEDRHPETEKRSDSRIMGVVDSDGRSSMSGACAPLPRAFTAASAPPPNAKEERRRKRRRGTRGSLDPIAISLVNGGGSLFLFLLSFRPFALPKIFPHGSGTFGAGEKFASSRERHQNRPSAGSRPSSYPGSGRVYTGGGGHKNLKRMTDVRLLDAPCGVLAGLGPGVGPDQKRVLLLGMGGGYDVFCAVPLFSELRGRGGDSAVFLGSLSFTKGLSGVTDASGEKLRPFQGVEGVFNVSASEFTAEQFGEDLGFPGNYFPELHLSRFLAAAPATDDAGSEDFSVLTFNLHEHFGASSPRVLGEALRDVCLALRIDTVVLVDAGVDSLLRGDEGGLGTFQEDMFTFYSSVVALEEADCVQRTVLMTIGLGSEGGISEFDFARNSAAVQRAGGFFGSVQWLPSVPSVDLYLRAVDSSVPVNTTINAQICDSIRGRFGNDCPAAASQRGVMNQDVFLNPMMGLMFLFDAQVAWNEKRAWFRDAIAASGSMEDLTDRTQRKREELGLVNARKYGRYEGPFPYWSQTATHNKLMDDAPAWARRTEDGRAESDSDSG